MRVFRNGSPAFRTRMAAIAVVGFLFSPAVFGGSLATPCTAGTLATYDDLNSDNMCSVGILNIDYFSFSSGGTTTSPLTASEIEVTPFTDGLSGGFTFSAILPDSFSAPAGVSADYEIDYEEIVDSGPAVTGSDMGMDPPIGDVTITQNLCADMVLVGSGTDESCEVSRIDPPVQTFSVDVANPDNHLGLNPFAFSFLDVSNLIDINDSLGGASGFDSYTTTQDVAIVGPEPAPFVLALTGLLGLAFRWRSVKRARV